LEVGLKDAEAEEVGDEDVDGLEEAEVTGLGDDEVLEESDITESVLSPIFVTNISFFPESYATPEGVVPTGTVATTALVLSEITDKVFEA
jgi:hypothetical protein